MQKEVEIVGKDIVESWFGFWPSFHDSEIVSIKLERQPAAPLVSVLLHAFQMTSEVTERGTYKCINHCIIEFEFKSADNICIEGFNHQNAIDRLEFGISKDFNSNPIISVIFYTAYGADLELTCSTVSVVSLVPGIPAGSVYA